MASSKRSRFPAQRPRPCATRQFVSALVHGIVKGPYGRHYLFYKATTDPATRGTYLASLDGGEPKLLLPFDNQIVGLAATPTAGNEVCLVFRRQELLPFDNQIVG